MCFVDHSFWEFTPRCELPQDSPDPTNCPGPMYSGFSAHSELIEEDQDDPGEGLGATGMSNDIDSES